MMPLLLQVFGICPAVLMSLMYSVNTEISGSSTIQKNYTINVMTSGVGIILGPILSGEFSFINL